VVPVALGTMFAAMISASLLPVIGWRGVALTGALPIVTSLMIAWIAPESVRWLLSRGRNADARREAAKLLGVPESSVTLPNALPPEKKSGSLSELLEDQKRFWWVVVIWTGISTGTYGVILWGPTILAQLLKIPAHQAAHYFVYASIFSMIGRVLFSVLPLYLGRRGAALVGTFMSVLVMLAIVAFYREFIAGWSVFALLVVFGAMFYSGIASFILLKLIGIVIPLRATRNEEGEGLDVTAHGEEAYMHVGGSAPVMREKTSAAQGSLSPARADV